MDVWGYWRAAGHSPVTAHGADDRCSDSSQEKCCRPVLKHLCSRRCVAIVGFSLLLGVSLLCYRPHAFWSSSVVESKWISSMEKSKRFPSMAQSAWSLSVKKGSWCSSEEQSAGFSSEEQSAGSSSEEQSAGSPEQSAGSSSEEQSAGSSSEEQSAGSSSEEQSAVTLLIWTHPFNVRRNLPDCWELSHLIGCTITDDKKAYPQADAVVFHYRGVRTNLPREQRPSAQKWIWMNFESPTNLGTMQHLESVYNLTMSYRTDSDIFIPYGYVIPRARTSRELQSRFAQPLHTASLSRLLRPHLVAWVISNWSENQARVFFFRQLRRYIQIDVFGGAGRSIPAGRDNVIELLRQYQFYLALENSQHTDYITEKLWNAVLAGAIPVVLGPSRKNYERFLPPEAFIHVDDFPTVEQLAQYLLMLRRSPDRMKLHLDWRENYTLHQTDLWADGYCAACRVVRRTRGGTNVVRDLRGWFRS